MNREEIKGLLPHREPMLLVDELELGQDGTAHGKYRVRGDEFFLQGHFPGNPVVPGVILCEIMAQSCALLVGAEAVGKTPMYTGLDKVKFRNPVRPGDTVEVTDQATLVVNGSTVLESDIYYTTPKYDNGPAYPLTLAEDEFFVLCDYREGARDSRYFGPVSADEVKGKVITVVRRSGL